MREQNKVSSGIIGELIIGEVPFWSAGVCKVRATDAGTIKVLGENDHDVKEVWLDDHVISSQIDRREECYDLQAIADLVNEAIEEEHERL